MIEADNRGNRTVSAQAVAATAIAAARVTQSPRRELGPAAKRLASEPVAPAISAVVLGGVVRLAEFVALAAVGFAIYGYYVFPDEGFLWRYVVATLAAAGAAIVGFQIADTYDVPAL